MEDGLEALVKVRHALAMIPDRAARNSNGKINTSCCANCLGGNAVERLQKCGRCKGAHYCSKACQQEHWPVHKSVCSQLPELKEASKDKREIISKHGPAFQKHYESWDKMNAPGLVALAHGLLRTPEQRRNFVVGLVTEYHPQHNPPIQIKDTPLLSLEAMQDTDPHLHAGITGLMRECPHRGPNPIVYAVHMVRNMECPRRVIPLIMEQGTFFPATPADMVKIININTIKK